MDGVVLLLLFLDFAALDLVCFLHYFPVAAESLVIALTLVEVLVLRKRDIIWIALPLVFVVHSFVPFELIFFEESDLILTLHLLARKAWLFVVGVLAGDSFLVVEVVIVVHSLQVVLFGSDAEHSGVLLGVFFNGLIGK